MADPITISKMSLLNMIVDASNNVFDVSNNKIGFEPRIQLEGKTLLPIFSKTIEEVKSLESSEA